MTYRFLRSMLFVACLSFVFVPHQVRAEINIAVVDVDVILSQAKAAKSIQKQVKSKREGFLSEVKKAEDELRNEQKSIEKQRATLSKEELMNKAQKFEKKRIDARNIIQKKKAKLDEAYTKAMNTLTKTISDICQDIATEDKIDLVITRQYIIVGSKSLDITQKVMDRLNKDLPKLTLKIK